MNRKSFLHSVFGGMAFFGLGCKSINELAETPLTASNSYQPSGSMFDFKDQPIAKVRVGIIGMGNRGKTLMEMFDWLVQKEHAEIVAISDLIPDNTKWGTDHMVGLGEASPDVYNKGEEDWKNLVKRDDIDLVLICTPWRHHTPMSLFSMENGKHVACEVPIAYTMEDCWKLVETAERTQRHCMMIENCCYNAEELFVLNMINEGVFGELTHAECAYLHDLRAHMFDDKYYQGQWRIKHHEERDGNFYTTHGIGPVSMYMDIGRGDQFKYLSSMSSQQANLTATAKKLRKEQTQFRCGDVNTTLLKTEKGRSVMVQFDTHTPRPYSRINQIVGTQATHEGYPGKLYVDDGELLFWGHQYMSQEDYVSYSKRYEHPLVKKLKGISAEFKQGHGGMDFVMMYRLIRCLNEGVALDFNVYDGVGWSAITPLSEWSVANKSSSIDFPDFSGGKWKEFRKSMVYREV